MPSIDTQTLLKLYEETNNICFFDLESINFKADYGSILTISVKGFKDKKPVTFQVEMPGRDKKIVRLAKTELEKYQCWVSYYGKGFDIKMINTRLLLHKYPLVEPRHHIDLYYVNKGRLALSRRSQAHIMGWLGQKEQKMSVSAQDWADAPADWARVKKTMKKRCESDVIGLQELYTNVRHIVRDLRR